MFPSNFSLAVAGDGEMLKPLVGKLVERFPGIVIYDRNEEAAQESSGEKYPSIPQVAYVDVLFSNSAGKETATIRCFHQHCFFNYDMKETLPGSKREEYLLQSMLNAVDQICELPKLNAVSEPEMPDTTEEPAASQEPEQTEQEMDEN